MSTQISIPVHVRPEEICREKTLGDAIALCAKVADFTMDKELASLLKVDKAQFSRWQSGTEGVIWPKLVSLMDLCGNDAPVLWMLHRRGYDLNSVRRVETALERENRILREQNAALMSLIRLPA